VLRAELAHPVGAIELGLRLEVAPGRCVALAGPSGAGKTTTLRLIAGTARPRRALIVRDQDVWVDTERGVWCSPEQRRCGYVFQQYALFPHLTAWRNVAYGLRRVPRKGRRAAAVELLARFGVDHLADSKPARLSGGEQQRVALARALAPRPSALLLDEPLSALDARTRAAATRELAGILRSLEIPVVLVTHDFHEAAVLGDEVGIIDAGRIVQRGSASELALAPATAFVADFTGAVVLTGTAHSAVGDLTIVELDGGGAVTTTDHGSGRVAVSIYPWEITLSQLSPSADESAQNRLAARVMSVTSLGARVRVGLAAGQPLVAEITGKAAEDLRLAAGAEVIASWKATATRLVTL
jgi:molybdate transport system ATP-binding protein